MKIVIRLSANLMPLIAVLFMVVGSSCKKSEERRPSDNEIRESFDLHADDDIVMTISSLIDAVSVGEPLDSLDYDYEGVLTDGSGRPLYTDLQGAPGVWDIEVVTPQHACIRNVYLGDLLPEDLEQYIISQISVTPRDHIESSEYDDDDEADLSAYDFGAGYLRFETRVGRTTNGLEGPLLTIRILSK